MGIFFRLLFHLRWMQLETAGVCNPRALAGFVSEVWFTPRQGRSSSAGGLCVPRWKQGRRRKRKKKKKKKDEGGKLTSHSWWSPCRASSCPPPSSELSGEIPGVWTHFLTGEAAWNPGGHRRRMAFQSVRQINVRQICRSNESHRLSLPFFFFLCPEPFHSVWAWIALEFLRMIINDTGGKTLESRTEPSTMRFLHCSRLLWLMCRWVVKGSDRWLRDWGFIIISSSQARAHTHEHTERRGEPERVHVCGRMLLRIS